MYQTILVTLDTTDADRTILEHVRPLAQENRQGRIEVFNRFFLRIEVSVFAMHIRVFVVNEKIIVTIILRQIALELLGDGLELVLTVANLSDRSMPCGFGFHPYFAMSRDSYLAVHAPSRLCPDKRGIPAVESTGLIGKHQLADLQISDDLLLDETGQVLVGTNDWELTLTAIEAVGWQFYLPADRAYFCLEPVSHRPDSFNLPEPIETIEPGSFRDWHFTVRRTR